MSDSEKTRPVPVVEPIRPIKRDNMMAVQSRTADLPAPFTPTRTLICSGNSNFSSGIPLNPSISMDSILICLPANRQQNVEHRPERRHRTPARRVRCHPGGAEEVFASERGRARLPAPKRGRSQGASCGASSCVIPPVRCWPRSWATRLGTGVRLSRLVPLNVHPSNSIDMVAPVPRRSTHGASRPNPGGNVRSASLHAPRAKRCETHLVRRTADRVRS